MRRIAVAPQFVLAAGIAGVLCWRGHRAGPVLANECFDQLDAPFKQRVIFEGAGCRPSFEQPAEFARVMRDVVTATSLQRAQP